MEGTQFSGNVKKNDAGKKEKVWGRMEWTILFGMIAAALSVLIITKTPRIEYRVDYAVNDLPGVTMECAPESESSTQVTLLLTNDTDRRHSYGAGYSLEKLVDDQWYTMSYIRESGFVAIEHYLEPGETAELTINWKYAHGKMDSGTYRIVKTVGYQPEPSYQRYRQHKLAAEFTI